MRLPIVPFVIATTLLAAAWYLFTATRSVRRSLDVPQLSRLTDIGGIETEVAVTRDGSRLAVIVSGDLWLLAPPSGDTKQLTQTNEVESSPAWTSDSTRITFTRGASTYAINPETGAEELFLSNATSLSWSEAGSIAFVRERALWIANPNSQDEKILVEADTISDIDFRSPRFSPNAMQVAFIKSQLGIRGEVWLVDVSDGMAQPLVTDRPAENPFDVGWFNDGKALAYLTNRAGAYSLWYVDLAASTLNPLTNLLMTVPLQRVGMAVWQNRIILPRHFVDSNIVLSDDAVVASSEKIEFQPAASPDGKQIAYTLVDENKFEIWTAGTNGEEAKFRTLGKQPRFSANGFEVVYTFTDLIGNDDIWKLDIRNGRTERVTDAEEIDVAPDWSSDGLFIAFSSARGGALSIWTIPASGGKRLRLNDGGYAPRYSPDSKSIMFWNKQALWSMDAQGSNNLWEIARGVFEPIAGVWSESGQREQYFTRPPSDRPVWPGFDVLPDGRFVLAPIDIRETSLWAIDITYKEN